MAGFTPSRDQVTDRDTELWKSLENKDLYKVLGVTSDASSKEIERAFRRKARDMHPDKHTDALSTERFKELSNAKELLLDIGKRWWYDQRREKEAEAIARALEGAKLRAKAKLEEDKCVDELAQDEEKRRQQFAVEKERFAKFLQSAQAQASAAIADPGESSDEECSIKSGQLRASAPEFVPAGNTSAPVPRAATGVAANTTFSTPISTPVADRVVEVYSISAQCWCLGFVVGINPLPGGRAALTVRYQVTEGQWNEKMLYDHDPNLRKRQHADHQTDRSSDLWNRWKDQHESPARSELRAEAPVFVPGTNVPPAMPSEPCRTRQLSVVVPRGFIGGQHINIVTDAGRPLMVQIPPGLLPGQTFLCSEPPAHGPGMLPPGQQLTRQTPSNSQPNMPCIRPPLTGLERRAGVAPDDSRCAVL